LSDGEVFDSAKLKHTIRFLIENDMRNIVIDLGNLEYLYSDAINAFIASNRHMLEVSGRIAILTEHPKVQDILKRAGLDNIMRIYRSEAEMIADSKEILRQTSSYRIEELQKISGQSFPPELIPDEPKVPRTEFDDFRLEMGQQLSDKLDKGETPEHQFGQPGAQATPPPTPPQPQQPTYNPNQTSYGQNPAYGAQPPQDSQPNYGQQAPYGAPVGFGGGSGDNFDYPTVQLPAGGYGNVPPRNDEGGDDFDDPENPRSRKSMQERMRSPNARRPGGRRIGGREELESMPSDEFDSPPPAPEPVYPPTYPQQVPVGGEGGYAPPIQPGGLYEEKSSNGKLFVFLLLFFFLGGGALYYFLNQESEPVTPPAVVEKPLPPPVADTAIAMDTNQVLDTVEAAGVEAPLEPISEPEPTRPSKPVAKPKPTPTPKPAPVVAPRPTPTPTPTPSSSTSGTSISITTEPPGAEVLVNFSKKGVTPLDVDLQNNNNRIILRLAGYKRYETTLNKNTKQDVLHVDLESEGGSTSSSPVRKPEVEPEPDPEPEPEPELISKPEPVRAPDPEPIRKPDPPKPPPPPEPEPIKESPKAFTPGSGPPGLIFLSSSPARADIYVDGKSIGKKTPVKVELDSGPHRIEMRKDGLKASSEKDVSAGKNKALHLQLK
jgi:anti-anti-sigma factor